MKFAYSEALLAVMKQAEEQNREMIEALSARFAETIMQDRIIHVFGTGHSHMIGVELFARAGGLGNINALLDPDTIPSFGAQRAGRMEQCSGVADAIFDSYRIEKGDLMVITSNSGRNAVPIEMAMRCQKEGIYTIAMTNVSQSKQAKSRHASGKKLYECADCVLDTCVPFGDALAQIGPYQSGPASTIVGMFLMNLVVDEAIRKVVAAGKPLYIFQSQNVDGFDNDVIYEHFQDRCKHF